MIPPRRRLALELVGVLAGLPLVFAGGMTLLLRGCDAGWGMCANDVLHEYPSPDRTLKVVVFRRGCGATTGSNIEASILEAGDSLPQGSGNITWAEAHYPARQPDPGVRWVGPRHLVITHDRGTVVRSQTEASGVQIDYEFRD